MAKSSFLEFKYGSQKKFSWNNKPTTQSSFSKETPKTSVPPSKGFQPNAEEMKWVFDRFDTNKDGKISKEEYKSAVQVLGKGMADTEVLKAFRAIDTDGDGFIDLQEFVEMMRNLGDGINKNDIQSAFQVYDLDGDGKISAEELMEVLRKMGENCRLEACRKMIRGVDTDGDGLINMDEFVTMMTRTMKLA